MIDFFANQAVEFFTKWNYPGAFFLMTLESMVAPVPSEIVMPPIGMLVASGQLSLWLSIIATSLGSITGSLISYFIGYYGGKPVVLKFGKYLLLNEGHLAWTEKWFHSRGGLTIFIGRFIPVVRHLISIPAGIGKMKILPFIIYTLIGATIWNTILLRIGMWLGNNWQIILKYRGPIDIAVVILLVIFVIYFVYSHLLPARKKNI